MNYGHAFALIVTMLTPAWAQQPKTDINDSLAKLHSANWTERYSGFSELSSAVGAMQTENVRNAILELLDREDQLIESTLRDSNEQIGVDDKYGEGYGEYVGQLGETADSFADWNNPHEVCVLVRQAYEWDGQYAGKVAAHPKTSIPCLIRAYKSDVGLSRAQAASTLVRALAVGEKDLDPETIQRAKQVILSAVQDPHDAVRSKTVRSLGRFGHPDMIPALAKLAQSDPVLKDTATKAISEIRKRAAAN